MPADAPLGTGESVTCQLRPPSEEAKTRAVAPPPVAKKANGPAVTRQVPLAANANSPVSASGMRSDGSTFHERPPSTVDAIRNFPSTGSESASPRRWSKNAMQS
jgi:hypothetical protein